MFDLSNKTKSQHHVNLNYPRRIITFVSILHILKETCARGHDIIAFLVSDCRYGVSPVNYPDIGHLVRNNTVSGYIWPKTCTTFHPLAFVTSYMALVTPGNTHVISICYLSQVVLTTYRHIQAQLWGLYVLIYQR